MLMTSPRLKPHKTNIVPMTNSAPPSPFRSALDHMTPNVAAELLRYGKSRPDVISLAQGEGESPTPDFIQKAAMKALEEGKTFYAPALGLPELRQEIANYTAKIYGRDIPTSRIFVTSSGTNAINLTLHSILNEGDDIVAVTPIWKNLIGICEVVNANIIEVCMSLQNNRWTLDLDALFDAVTPKTRAIMIVSPNNPTGWVMSETEIKAVMEFARSRGIWIVADEIYARCQFGKKHAPSFLDVAVPDDLLFVINSFSKSWAMTGWRLGWIIGPQMAEDKIRDLALYQNMGPPCFTQYGGIAALRYGEDFIQGQMALWHTNRDIVSQRLAHMSRITFPIPDATFYAFFKVDGVTNSMQFAREMIDEVGLSLAPGSSFGSRCEGFLRLCYGVSTPRLHDALDRLERLCG
jgi:aspartate aminotransferase